MKIKKKFKKGQHFLIATSLKTHLRFDINFLYYVVWCTLPSIPPYNQENIELYKSNISLYFRKVQRSLRTMKFKAVLFNFFPSSKSVGPDCDYRCGGNLERLLYWVIAFAPPSPPAPPLPTLSHKGQSLPKLQPLLPPSAGPSLLYSLQMSPSDILDASLIYCAFPSLNKVPKDGNLFCSLINSKSTCCSRHMVGSGNIAWMTNHLNGWPF